MAFGEKLKAARLNSKMTQFDLAKRSGISLRSIQNWENGYRRPSSIESVEKISTVLNVRTIDLLDTDDQFIVDAHEKYGARGKKDAEELLSDVTALFAGGEMNEEDMDIFMQGIQEAYWKVKEINRSKYTPKKYRNN